MHHARDSYGLDDLERAIRQHAGSVPGGDGDLYPDLSWTNRPDMSGSAAPESLEDAWVATMLAIRELCGTVRNGTCHLINLAAAPLVEQVLGEPVEPCAGFGAFVGAGRRIEFGLRWRPPKWARWLDATRGSHLRPEQDVHTWLETGTHVVDFSTGDNMSDLGHSWPPLIFWPKWKFPKHPREAREKGAILLWRNEKAIELVSEHLAPIVLPIAWRAMHILETQGGADLGLGKEECARFDRPLALRERPPFSLECAPPPPLRGA